ncbi:MAG: WYL domain-containing protein [Comamonadaceae bacterium]|nr:MAG: WYL domain-containing protein [Comamonadaceae bacterium]
MNHSTKTHNTLVYRLSQVLTKLNQGESLDPQSLATEFGVNLRTMQRDLNVRFASLPLVKSGGRYRMEEAHLGKLTIKDIEKFAALSGVSGLFPKLTDQFLRDVFDSSRASAWLVKGHHYEDLRGQTRLFAELERAIVDHRYVEFTYTKTAGQGKLHSQVEPYKLINNKGIWYLAAWDEGRLKSFSVTKMEALWPMETTFPPRSQIEKELATNDSVWLGEKRERVLLRVGAKVAEYFKRRQLIPNQLIEKELDGGDLLVSTTVAHADEVLPIVRYWIPHVRILEPLAFQKQLERGLTGYLRQAPDKP